MAKTEKLSRLRQTYEFVCNEYAQKFANRQEMEFDVWVGNEVGGVGHFNDFTFNFRDIVWDVNTKQPKGLIIDWYYESIDNHPKYINYYSYSKGLRYEDLKD